MARVTCAVGIHSDYPCFTMVPIRFQAQRNLAGEVRLPSVMSFLLKEKQTLNYRKTAPDSKNNTDEEL